MTLNLWMFLLAGLIVIPAMAQEPEFKSGAIYRKAGGEKLSVNIYYPKSWKTSDKRPALICFHGGGWAQGGLGQFSRQAKYFSQRGVVAMCFEYRLVEKNTKTKTKTIGHCLEDAKAAYHWVADNASILGIDADKIVLMGGSAGGHLAAAVAMCPNPDSKASVLPSKPFAMVLYNPVLDVPEFLRGRTDKISHGASFAVSPMHHLSKDVPPTLVLHGTADTGVPFATAVKFIDGLKALGVDAKLIPYEDRKHGFFNGRKKGKKGDYKRSVNDADLFLVHLGLLQAKPSSQE